MSDGTGWVGDNEFSDVAYSSHANAKLTTEQKEEIAKSGESESQWIREAVQERIDREHGSFYAGLNSYKTTPQIERAILHLKMKKRMIELTSEKERLGPEAAADLAAYEKENGITNMADVLNAACDAIDAQRAIEKENS
jgi:hypothetical protein